MTTLLVAVVSWFILTWTAPGDDKQKGTADQYDLRIHSEAITNHNWDSCLQLQAPQPSPAGTPQVCTVYFAIRSLDEAGNESGPSNVATGSTPDAYYPCADLDGDLSTDIVDVVWLVDWMFLGGPPPNCGDTR